ncbi:MAG: hypothetical protein RLN85_16500, partial [Pseudomonadales bacterium]
RSFARSLPNVGCINFLELHRCRKTDGFSDSSLNGSYADKTPNAEAMAFVTLDTQLHMEPSSLTGCRCRAWLN